MKGMEFNKIFAAILVAGIVASLSGFISEKLYHEEPLEEMAYPIEAADAATAGAPKKKDMPQPILAMLAGADIAKGEKITKVCHACHSFNKGGPNATGPNLWNVTTRGHADQADFDYSAAMSEHKGQPWSYEALNHFLWKPKKVIPGTKMNFIGLKKATDRADVIAYLRTLDDNPLPLPTDKEIKAEEAALSPEAPAKEVATDAVEKAEDAAVESANDAAHVTKDDTEAEKIQSNEFSH